MELLNTEPPLYIKWVTKRKRDKVQERLIVVGRFRIFSIKKTLTGKKKVRTFDPLYYYSPSIIVVWFSLVLFFVQNPPAYMHSFRSLYFRSIYFLIGLSN